MRKLPALIAAFLITACIGLGMLALGTEALLNKNGVAAANAPVPASAPAGLQQMQDLVAQYQQREQQYQAELESARQQLQQDATQIQQYQNLIQELAERGQIFIGRDGRILIPDR